ncbi:Cap protein [Bo-Circo-like virus CH]|nr:Cap protein [Bo-Circo-like virus CH]
MPRRYTRSGRYTRRVKTVKYSNETYNYAGSYTVQNASTKNNWHETLISAIDQQGVRKCKNFELSLTGTPFVHDDTVAHAPMFFALVYVPQGTEPSQISIGNPDACASLYEPNQNVIMCGVWPSDLTATFIKKPRLALNLNSGDRIDLVMSVPPFGDGPFENKLPSDLITRFLSKIIFYYV